MKRKDIKHTALFSAFVLISIALIFIAGLSFHFPTASILVVVLIWLFAVAVFSGMSSQEIENAFVNGAKKGSAAILLLLCVGVIVSMWIQSGMVPMIIYYGLGLFSPQILLLCTFLLCVLLSVCTGSSWGCLRYHRHCLCQHWGRHGDSCLYHSGRCDFWSNCWG